MPYHSGFSHHAVTAPLAGNNFLVGRLFTGCHGFAQCIAIAGRRTGRPTSVRPIEAGSLHEGRLDMVVYYVPADGDLLEVTATFAPKGGGDPQRVVMASPMPAPWPSPCRAIYAFSTSDEKVMVSTETTCVREPMRYRDDSSARPSMTKAQAATSNPSFTITT